MQLQGDHYYYLLLGSSCACVHELLPTYYNLYRNRHSSTQISIKKYIILLAAVGLGPYILQIESLLTFSTYVTPTALHAQVQHDIMHARLPSVQPFHAMAYPFSAELAVKISQRYAKHCALQASRLGVETLPHPPALPLQEGEVLRIAYVSSDFGNHPLSHLMQSVFGLHNRSAVRVYCYALSPNDGSQWRQKVEREADVFLDVSACSVADIARQISMD